MKDSALYLEVDEDITSAIDKLGKIDGSTVQIVVPKRSTMLQSIINLKLLKKAAADSHKELVLVTGDKLAVDLAARVGLAVAPSLGAKAVINDHVEAKPTTNDDIIEEDDPTPPPAPEPEVQPEPEAKPKKPLFSRREVDEGAAAAVAGASAAEASSDGEPAAAEAADKPKGPKVPNFGKFNKRLLWVGLAVVLVVAFLVLNSVFASAKVVLYANGTKVDIDTTFAADPNLHTTDTNAAVLAADTVTLNKTVTAPFTPTGQKDVGTKAHGTVSIRNCEDTNSYPLAAGNTLSSGGYNFTTDSAITIPAGTFTNHGANCTSAPVSVAITAVANGDHYNLTNASFTSAKLTSNFSITGTMTGGTTKNVTVVQQSDIDAAKTAALANDKDDAQKALASKIDSDHQGLSASLVQNATAVTSSPALGEQGDTASLSITVTYTELAVGKTDFGNVVKAAELKQIGAQNQIYDDGLGSATISQTAVDPGGKQTFHLTTEAFSGAKLDKTAIATQLAGHKQGDANDLASGLPGVQRVDINLSPVWATSLPKRPGKINVTIQVAGK